MRKSRQRTGKCGYGSADCKVSDNVSVRACDKDHTDVERTSPGLLLEALFSRSLIPGKSDPDEVRAKRCGMHSQYARLVEGSEHASLSRAQTAAGGKARNLLSCSRKLSPSRFLRPGGPVGLTGSCGCFDEGQPARLQLETLKGARTSSSSPIRLAAVGRFAYFG